MRDEIVLLIPSLDPDEKLVNTVESMINQGFSKILLVNDGSKEENLWPFNELGKYEQVCVIGYEENKGKGYALKYGFKYILDHYENIKGVVTADGDGQHLASDCIKLADSLIEKDEVIFGCRNFKSKDVPIRNKTGNTISIFVYDILCGIKLSDTQTGLRGIPYKYLNEFLSIEGDRFEYETNMLLYMKANGFSFNELPITTVYEKNSNKGSHFHVVKDSIRVYKPLVKSGGPLFLRYCIGSFTATIIETALFALFTAWLSEMRSEFLATLGSVFVATVLARIVSAIYQYFFNKKLAFHNHDRHRMIRFAIVVICQLSASSICVAILSYIFGANVFLRTVFKLIVDEVLFFFGFKMQREWVFK